MLNSAIIPLTCAVESLTIVWLLSKSGIGSEIAIRIYGLEDGIVGSLINMPIVVATSISTVLVPNLTLSFSKNNVNEITNKCNKIHLIVLFFVLLLYNILEVRNV